MAAYEVSTDDIGDALRMIAAQFKADERVASIGRIRIDLGDGTIVDLRIDGKRWGKRRMARAAALREQKGKADG